MSLISPPVLWAAPVNSFAVLLVLRVLRTRLRPLLTSLLRVRTDAVTVELTSSSEVQTSKVAAMACRWSRSNLDDARLPRHHRDDAFPDAH